MSHVFISYARATAPQAQQVAARLRELGHEVWLDDAIPAHRAYTEVIEERLREARAVVVIWSAEAAKSEWVRSEADRARAERKLVQLTVDGAPLPMPFDQIQCASLVGWQGDPTSGGWKKVVESVVELLGGRAPSPAAGPPHPVSSLSATPARFSVAVASFADPAGAVAGDDFADGLGAEIATALTRFPILLVVDAGPASGARYQLEGSVRRSGSRVRINVQLCDAAQRERVWADRFDSALDDPFALQDDIAQKVAGRVETAILAHETRRLAGRPVDSLAAHELSLRARETIRRAGLEQLAEIEALSERAVALEPAHAYSQALLATAVGFRIAFGGAGADVAALGTRLAETVNRAMLAGADDPDVLVFVAEALLLADRDRVTARALTDRALKMNPALVVGWDIAGNVRMWGGEYEEALASYERCLQLDPNSPWRTYVWPSMAGCLVAMGRFDEAIVLAKEGLQIGPNNPWAAAHLIAALAHSGRIAEARAAFAQFDPRQAGIFKTSGSGPRLTALIHEALKLVDGRKQD